MMEASEILLGHELAIVSVKFSPCGKFLASASSDKSIRIWYFGDEGKWSLALILGSGHHAQGVNDVAWSCHSKWLCSASDDASILVWDIESSISTMKEDGPEQKPVSTSPVRILKGHSSYVFCLNFNPSSTLIASGSYDESIKLWDVYLGTCHRTIAAHSDPVSSVNFSPDGTLLVSASFDGLIRIWDSYSGQCLKTLVDDDTHAPISFVNFSPNAKYLVTCSLDNTIRLWSYMLSSNQVVRQYKGHQSEKYCTFASFLTPFEGDPASSVIISGSEDGFIYVWNVSSQNLVTKFRANTGPIAGLDLFRVKKEEAGRPAKYHLAVGSLESEKTLKLYELDSIFIDQSSQEDTSMMMMMMHEDE